MIYHNFYPIQPSFVFHTSKYYKRRVFNSPIAHFYSFQCELDVVPVSFIIPDAAIDILFDLNESQPSALVCGSVLEPKEHILKKGHEYFGARLVPGQMNRFMNISAKELTDHTIDLESLLISNHISEQLLAEKSFEGKIVLFHTLLASINANHFSDTKTNIIQTLLYKIYQSQGNIKVNELERITLYSRQYLSRLFKEYTGVGIKQFCKIIRFQNVLKRINTEDHNTSTNAAMEGGFYDQSHFIKDFHNYIMLSPTEYHDAVHQYHYNQIIKEL